MVTYGQRRPVEAHVNVVFFLGIHNHKRHCEWVRNAIVLNLSMRQVPSRDVAIKFRQICYASIKIWHSQYCYAVIEY